MSIVVCPAVSSVTADAGEADEKKMDAGEDGVAPTDGDEAKMEDGDGLGDVDASHSVRLNTDLPLVRPALCLIR